MSKKTFIRAEEGKPPGISVIYYDTDGNETIRYHDKNGKIGSHAWRNNNPGNLGWGSGDHAKKTGCIGKAKKRPVFPDYVTGKQSMRLLLKEDFYQRLTLNELPRKYTGVKPGDPDTEEVIIYRKAIRVLIQEYIIEPEKPQEIQLKPIEQSYQTNKKMKQFNISEDEMDRMLHIARQAQDLELIEKLKVKQGFYSEDDRGWY